MCIRDSVASLPVGVVVRVFHQVVPEPDFALQIVAIRVRQRAEVEKESITVGSPMCEPWWKIRGRLGTILAERCEEVERVRQKQRAVVMKVIADEPVGD